MEILCRRNTAAAWSWGVENDLIVIAVVTVENRLAAFALAEFLTIAASGSPNSDNNLLVFPQFGISLPF
jgi:hypothetical protein